MRRVFPPGMFPRAVKDNLLPHPEGHWRAKLTRKTALTSYLLFFSVLLLTLVGLDSRFPGVLGFATDIKTDDIVSLTNQERVGQGLKALKWNDQLAEAAKAKAQDMFLDNYWAHVAPDGTEPWDFVDASGYVYLTAGENLAKDFDHSNSVVKAWMDSPSHRDNLLNAKFEDIGVAVVNGELSGFETTLVVQMFGRAQPGYLAVSEEAAAVPERSPAEAAKPEPKVEAAKGVEVGMALEEPGPRPLVQTQVQAQVPGIAAVAKLDLKNFAVGAGFIVVVFLAGLLLLDFVLAARKRELRVTLRTLAHLALLIFLLVGIWYSQVGAIL